MSTEGNYFCSVNLGKSNIRVSDGGVTHAHKHAGIPLTHHSLLTLTHTLPLTTHTHHSPLTIHTHHSPLTLTLTLTLTTRHTPHTQMHTTQNTNKHIHKHTPLLGLVTSFDIT